MFAFAYSWWFSLFGAMPHGHCCFKALNENPLTMGIWQMLLFVVVFHCCLFASSLWLCIPHDVTNSISKQNPMDKASMGQGIKSNKGLIIVLMPGLWFHGWERTKPGSDFLVLTAVIPRERSTSPKFQEMDVKRVKERMLVELAEHCGQWEEGG